MKPTYFDLTVSDVDHAKTFFGNVLGWRFTKFEMPYEYYRIQAGPEGQVGIDGGIGGIKDSLISEGRPMTQITVPVSDLNDVLARVIAAGGAIVEPRMPFLASAGTQHAPSPAASTLVSSRLTKARGDD